MPRRRGPTAKCTWRKRKDTFLGGRASMWYGYCDTETIRHRWIVRRTPGQPGIYRLLDDGGLVKDGLKSVASAKAEARRRTGDW